MASFSSGSDASPIIEYTNKVIYLDDEEIAILKRDKEPKIITISNIQKTPEIKQLEMNLQPTRTWRLSALYAKRNIRAA